MSGVFLYDGDCGFCTTSVRWLQAHTTSAAQVVPWQHADLAPLGVSPEECAEAVQWVGDGERAVGPGAIAAYLQTSTNSWRTAGRVLASPAVQHVSWPVYRWFARHRGSLPGGIPATELPRVSVPVKGIRRRRPNDLAACGRLLHVISTEGQYPVARTDAPRAWLADSDVIDAWIAERQGKILGHIAVSRVGLDTVSALRWRELTGHQPSELAGVSRLFVRPGFRGEGIGAALLDVAVAEIRAGGLIPVLDVASASTDAIKLFEGRGWRNIAVLPRVSEGGDKHMTYWYASPVPLQTRSGGTGRIRVVMGG